MNTPQPPNDNPSEPTVGHAEYRKPELRELGISSDAFNALWVEKLREEKRVLQAKNKTLETAVKTWRDLAQGRESEKWVSVKESLPNEFVSVLAVAIKGGSVVTYLTRARYMNPSAPYWVGVDSGFQNHVKFWRELPQPPSA